MAPQTVTRLGEPLVIMGVFQRTNPSISLVPATNSATTIAALVPCDTGSTSGFSCATSSNSQRVSGLFISAQ